jgi:MarR family transcriptional regulator, organic hydroperoxide resistance regulator
MYPLTVTLEPLLGPSGSDETFRQFINDLVALSTRLEVIRAGFGKLADLTGVEFTLLVAVGHHEPDGPVFVNALADYMHLSGAFVTLQTNRLAQKGLLQKVRDQKDGRRVILKLSKKASRLLDQLAEQQCAVNDIMFTGMNGGDFRKLAQLVAKLVPESERAIALVQYMASERE